MSKIVVDILRVCCPVISAKAKSFKAREAREIDLYRFGVRRRCCMIA